MKQTSSIMLAVLVAAVFAVVSVSATQSTLSDPAVSMALSDVRTVQYCAVNSSNEPYLNLPVVINPLTDVCKDVNGIEGCQPGDLFNPPGFSAVVVNSMTNSTGCDPITLTTSLAPADAGTFYYTVNGQEGDVTITSVTGQVLTVPEFGVVAAGLVLVGAALFIGKRR